MCIYIYIYIFIHVYVLGDAGAGGALLRRAREVSGQRPWAMYNTL